MYFSSVPPRRMSLRPGRGGQPTEPLLAPSAAVSTAPTAAVIAAWFLWVLGTIFALVAMILAAVILSRANSIQDAVSAVQACCAEVYSTVSSILSILTTFITTGCTPIFGPQALYSGCYFFAYDIECDLVDSICFPAVGTGDIDVDMHNQALYVSEPNTTAFAVYFSPNFRIRNGRMFTGSPTNSTSSIGLDISASNSIRVEKVQFTNFYRPINFAYSNYLDVEYSIFEGANQINWDDFNNAVIFILGSNQTTIRDSKFFNNNVRAVLPNDYRQYASHGIQSTSLDGYPCIGLTVEYCQLVDTRIRQTSFSFISGISDLHINHNTMQITDPLYDPSAIEVGDTFTVWNGTNTIDLAVVPVTGVEIDNNGITNMDAHPAYDAILAKMMTTFKITRNTIQAGNNAFYPDGGNIVSALIHLGTGNSGIDYQEINPFGVQGGSVQDNTLIGRANSSDTSNNRAAVGVLVEAYSSAIAIVRNKISGIAAGMPAGVGSGQCQAGAWSAQQPAGVWISAGSSGIHALENSIWDGSCANGDFTVAASGVVVAGSETRRSFCDTGTNVFFPAADNCVVEGNTVWDFCGTGINNLGTNSRVLHNKAHGNTIADYHDTGSPRTIIQSYGTPILAGWNLNSSVIAV